MRALLPLAQNYLASDVFRRVSKLASTSAGDRADEIHRLKSVPQSSSGLWSELRFRLRRPLGILTGTIDKLLITPNGNGVDVEIIDFKTNRFSLPPAPAIKTVRSATATATVITAPGQTSFDFEAIVDEASTSTFAASLDEQAQRIA